MTSPVPILNVLAGQRMDPPPVWFMRQAGRYLPEYRELRAERGSFLNLVYDPEAAAEVTMQPLRRFGFDGAILFSDILIVPHALGQDLRFAEGEGPRLSPTLDETPLESLEEAPERLDSIYRTVGLVRASLPSGAALIGFAGSPWTVATYMIAGQGTKEQGPARLLAYRDPERMRSIIDRIASTTVEYLCGQIEAGAQAVQLFDSWSGSLAPDEFARWVIAPTRNIVEDLKRRHPDIPVIGFPKGAGAKLPAYAAETGVDALGLDETVDPLWAHSALPHGLPVQGNLDPMALLAGAPVVVEAVKRIKTAFADRPHIFNLGHGISRFTPIPHVERALEEIRK